MPATSHNDYHVDTLLTNMLIGYRPMGFVGQDIFPVLPVMKESDLIAQIQRGDWFRVDDTLRAPATRPKEGTWTVSSQRYSCVNYAFATKVPYETLDNTDAPHDVRARAGEFVTDKLTLDHEVRVVNRVVAGVGSTTTLTGVNAWSDYANSQPLDDVDVAKEAIRSTTGMAPNVCVIAHKTWLKLRRHPDVIRAIYPGAGVGGTASPEQFANLIGVGRVLLPMAIRNTGAEGAADAYSDVWSSYFVLAHVANPGLMVATFGTTFRWTGQNIGGGGPGAFQVERRRDDDLKCEWVRAGYYQDEKIIAPELGFMILTGITS